MRGQRQRAVRASGVSRSTAPLGKHWSLRTACTCVLVSVSVSSTLTALLVKFIQLSVMEQLQAQFPEQYRETSAHRFRSSTDMQFGAAWFVETQPNHVHGSRLAASFVALTDKYVGSNEAYETLCDAWAKPENKLVCINDNTAADHMLPFINKQVVEFLPQQYPEPAEFELSAGRVNGCRYLAAKFGTLPSQHKITAACKGGNVTNQLHASITVLEVQLMYLQALMPAVQPGMAL